MKKFLGVLVYNVAFGALPLYAVDLDVSVKNPSGAGIAGAQVIAVQFTDSGVSTQTKTAVTNAAGLAQFTGGNTLGATNLYDIFATTQGYLPSLGDQYEDHKHPNIVANGSLSPITITLSSAGASNLGEIDVDVEDATASSLIFGEIRSASGDNRDAVARGFVTTHTDGFATRTNPVGALKIFNVPFASTNAYTIVGIDMASNRSYNFPGQRELAPYRKLIRYTSSGPDPLTDFGQLLKFGDAIPEQQTQNVTQNYATTGDVSVEGAVVDTTTAQTPIPYVGVNFGYMRSDAYCGTGCSQNVWGNTDTNGRFQLFGLQPNTSYYAQVYGGCNWQTGVCYEGSNSTWTAYSPATSAPLGLNDFYYAGTPLIKKIKLNKSSGGSGQIAVYVKSSLGSPMPQSNVSLWPDGQQWETGGTCDGNPNNNINAPGLANANVQATTGYALISNLPAGNYSLQAWTQFSNQGGVSYNAGPDGMFSWGGNNCPSDDLRVTVSTTAPYVRVFNSAGVLVGGTAVSSITITVSVPVYTSGLVKGTLTFPGVVDLSNDPINITLQPQCNSNCSGGGGFTVINAASTGPTVNYAVNVSSGQTYWMNVTSNYWGIVRTGGGNNDVQLVSTGTVIRDMTFAPAGRLVGKLYKPNTSLFQPTFSNTDNVSANINASGNNSWGWGQLNQDGSFALGGLLPGSYKLRVNGWGKFTYTDPDPIPTEEVSAGLDTYRDLRLVDGVALKINVSTASLPAMNRPNCAGMDSWNCPPEQWAVVPVPRGTDFSQKIAGTLVGDDDYAEFGYAASTTNAGSRCNGPVEQPGFCVKRVASPTTLDFYLLRKGQFDEGGVDGVRPFFVILNSTKNITVNSALATDLYVQQYSTITVQTIDLSPAAPMSSALATLRGSVIATNLIRQQDFEALGGKFDNFIKFIPILSLFDSSGTLRAAAAAVPNPVCFAHGAGGDQFDQAVAAGNWTLFKSILNSCPPAPGYAASFGYEVRGLNPGQTYTAVLTSPNYPTYQAPVTLGIAGSTLTLNINLDLSVGSGATLTGVVASTNGVVIANASVAVEAPGFNKDKPKTLTTNSLGVYKLEGLGAGTYTISVVAAGYALANVNKDVSGTASFTANFAMRVAGATITGKVRSAATRKLLSGVNVFAYNETVNVNDPAAELPLYRAVTSSIGVYSVDGLEVGVTYKLFFRVPGHYIDSTTTKTVAGIVPGIDFKLWPKPVGALSADVFARSGGKDYTFSVLNPGNTKYMDAWIGESPFVKNAVTTVNVKNRFASDTVNGNKQLSISYPLSSLLADRNYVLHLEATDLSQTSTQTITQEILFGLSRQGDVAQSIDETLLGDKEPDEQGVGKSNEAMLDRIRNENNPNHSALSFPVGALIPVSTDTIPSCKFSHVALGTSPAAAVLSSTAAFASGVYQLELSSVSIIPGKGFDLVLAYDKTGSNLSDIAVHTFNAATRKWDVVPGLQTIDPLKGTVTIKRIKSLASVLGLKAGSPMRAMSDGETYTPNSNYRARAASDSGSFAVMRPSLVGTSYAGTTIKVFNFPNPFNLTSKTNTLVHGGATASLTTAGTVIKYELPSNISGHVYIRIYTLAGELVQEFDQGEQSGGSYYYTAWEGKNNNVVEVANGVYYGILSVPGAKLKDSTFKMAVIK